MWPRDVQMAPFRHCARNHRLKGSGSRKDALNGSDYGYHIGDSTSLHLCATKLKASLLDLIQCGSKSGVPT